MKGVILIVNINLPKKPKINSSLVFSTPCAIIDIARWTKLSAVVMVCGTNFCTFVSDGRCVKFDKNGKIIGIRADDFQKIFKLNEKLIYGTSGQFNLDGDILAPFDEYPDKSVLTMNMAIKCIERHLERCNYGIGDRTFLLGGKNNKGQFQLNTFVHKSSFSPVEKEVLIPSDGQFYVKTAIPPDVNQDDIRKLLNKNIYGTSPWSSLDDLKSHMRDTIIDISKINNSVGGKIMEYTIV